MNQAPSILLIDDNELIRELARDLLRQEFPDSQIRTVDGLDSLRQALETGGFDIIITDYQLGWTDGLAVLREVKSRYPDCPVVMFTATGSEEIAVEAMKAGLDDYVLKSPKHITRLSASIRAVLAQAAERRTARDAEARYRSLINDVLDTSAVGLFILDASFGVVWINEAMERYFGIRRADVIGRDKRQLIRDRIKQLFDQPEEFAARILQSYERNSCELCFECHMPAADGREERWLEHRSMPIRTGLYAGGRIEHYYDITGQKRSEATLREHEQQLRLFTLATNDLFWNFDMVSGTLARSVGFTRAFGYAAEEMTPNLQWWEDRLHPDDRERVLSTYRDALAGGATTCSYEYRFRCRDGSYAMISDRAYIVRDKTGKPVRSLGAMTDITERKQAEMVLQEREELLGAMGDMAEIGGWEFDAATRKGTWTDEVARIHEVEVGQETDVEKGLSFFHGESRRTIETAVNAAVELGQPYDVELELVTAKGNRKWVRTIGRPIKEGTKVVKVRGAIQDITERKQAEGRLRRSNDTLSSLIQASPMAITMLDAEGKVRVWNPAAERIFGWSAEEVLGRPLPTVPEERQAEHREFVARVLADQAFTALEVVRRRKDGSPITISLSVAPLRNAEGRITGVMGIMADVTERKQMERYAGRIERLAALGQLLGGIAHEIKNPLFVLTGRLQLLNEKLAARDYGALPSDLDKIGEAAKRMTRVMERFLTLARPAHLQHAWCDIRTILDETLDFLSNELMKSQIRLVVETPPDLPAIWSDPRQLQETFLNLLLNAVQAMVAAHGKGTLTVSAALVTDGETRGPGDGEQARRGDAEKGRGGDTEIAASPRLPVPASADTGHGDTETRGQGEGERWIEVRIQDDGPGISPEHRAKLFEPFFTTKPPEEGTGLGLWTVRMIVMALGGAVTCESEVGRGATFIVRLPVIASPLQPAAHRSPGRPEDEAHVEDRQGKQGRKGRP